jgi:hypothetical protein
VSQLGTMRYSREMNARLRTILTDAEARLGADEQVRLAELVEAFVSTHSGASDFSEAELAHLRHVDEEAFAPADADAVAALLARRA